MNPVLYPIGRKILVGNGLGVLHDVNYCRCTEVLNGLYEVEFQISKDSVYASEIKTDCVIKVKPNYEDEPQLFRIYSISKEDDGMITVKASHISYDTCGIPIKAFSAKSLEEVVENLNTNRILLSESPFVLNADFSSDIAFESKTPASFRNLLGGSDASIIGVYGGEYHYDNYAIQLTEKRGQDKGVCFRYGKNILEFEYTTSSEELYSGIMGFWRKSGSNDQNDTIIYGNIIQCEGEFPYDKIYILDTSNDIKNDNDADATVDQIDGLVKEYILKNAIGVPKNQMKIDYAEDDNIIKVCLGDRVGIQFPAYGINAIARCTKCVFDCLLERNESIEIGTIESDVSNKISSMSNSMSVSSSNTGSGFAGVSAAISNLQEQITANELKIATETMDVSESEKIVDYEGVFINAYATMRGIVVTDMDISIESTSVTFTSNAAHISPITLVVIYV